MINQVLNTPSSIYTWLHRNGIVWFGLCLGILVACQSISEPPPRLPSPLQVNLEGYKCDMYYGGFRGTIENHSTDTIEFPGICHFTFYIRTFGWESRESVESFSGCNDPFTIAPGETLEIKPTEMRIACNESYIVSAPYKVVSSTTGVDNRLYKMYSDMIDVGDVPTGTVGGLLWTQITFNLPSPKITIVNKASRSSKWMIPLCAGTELADKVFVSGWYPYATLEHATTWGTWEVIVPDRAICTTELELIRVPPQSTRTITLWEGTNFDMEQLEAGWYRWNVVYYGAEPVRSFGGAQHRFSEIFEIRK